MNNKYWEYVKSALTTFTAIFLGVILLNYENLTLEALQSGAYISIIFTALRSGLKSVIELSLTWLNK